MKYICMAQHMFNMCCEIGCVLQNEFLILEHEFLILEHEFLILEKEFLILEITDFYPQWLAHGEDVKKHVKLWNLDEYVQLLYS